jgi:predicted nucleic acid-binding protein
VIFVDSNIPMYLVGSKHPNKGATQEMLGRAVLSDEALVTSAEVYQEILHRYTAISRLDAIPPTFALLDAICEEVASVTEADVHTAKDLVLSGTVQSSRDALHVAVMRRIGSDHILSFDGGFDGVPGITRTP